RGVGQATAARRKLAKRQGSMDGRRSQPGDWICSHDPRLLPFGQINRRPVRGRLPAPAQACQSTRGESVVRVTQLSAFSVRIPLKRPIRHASHSREDTDNLIVRARLEDGTEGVGEGVPRDYVTGETIDSAIAVLRDTRLGDQLADCGSFADAVGMAERLRLEVAGDERQCQANAARCALELAILDAYGKHFQTPISQTTRILTPALYEPRAWVRYSGVIASANGPKAHLAAWRIRLWRFPDLKVKIGMSGHDDLWRLRTIRKIVGR